MSKNPTLSPILAVAATPEACGAPAFWRLDRMTIGGRALDVTAGVYNYDSGADQDLAGDTARDMAMRAALEN